ncbi:MAG: hypothetical protein ACR2PW_02125 [Gammaproteobacteria bacterium]
MLDLQMASWYSSSYAVIIGLCVLAWVVLLVFILGQPLYRRLHRGAISETTYIERQP